jgi:C-terminal processing protease CtpA/Prc
VKSKFLILILSILVTTPANSALQEQNLNQPVKKILYNSRSETKAPFKLGVEEGLSTFEPSNIGIIGVKYLHRVGEMSTIIAVYPHTPAESAGVLVGDKLLSVDGVNIMNFNADQVYAMIAGRPGEPIDLKLMRCPVGAGAGCRTFNVNLQRMDMNEIASDNVYKVYRYGL